MKVTVTYNDKSVQVNLTDAQLETLGLKEKKKPTGYERVGTDDPYYFVEWNGEAGSGVFENHDEIDDQAYASGNYFSNKCLAEANARADSLMWKLRRFAAENGGIPSVWDWNYTGKHKYVITYDYSNESMLPELFTHLRIPNAVHFNSKVACQKAIEEFKDELTWYFTEYQAMLY